MDPRAHVTTYDLNAAPVAVLNYLGTDRLNDAINRNQSQQQNKKTKHKNNLTKFFDKRPRVPSIDTTVATGNVVTTIVASSRTFTSSP